jgi:DNA replication protein DnaC
VCRIERHRIDSALSPDKRLSSFDFNAVPTVSKAQMIALASGTEWFGRGANVLLVGAPGVGKSHLISGLPHVLIDAGRRVAQGPRWNRVRERGMRWRPTP